MLRQSLLWLSQQNSIFNLLRTNPLARSFASRFVAGETIDAAVRAAEQLAERGITASLDLLVEHGEVLVPCPLRLLGLRDALAQQVE